MPSVSRQAFAPVSSPPDQEHNLPAYYRSPVPVTPESVSMELDDAEEISEHTVVESQGSDWAPDGHFATVPSSDMGSIAEAQISYVTRKGLPSSPVGHTRAHTLTFPENHGNKRERRYQDRDAYSSSTRSRRTARTADTHTERSGRMHVPQSARRSISEKPVRSKVYPIERSRSTPTPYVRTKTKRGFWRSLGLWAKIVMSRFRGWTQSSSPTTY